MATGNWQRPVRRTLVIKLSARDAAVDGATEDGGKWPGNAENRGRSGGPVMWRPQPQVALPNARAVSYICSHFHTNFEYFKKFLS